MAGKRPAYYGGVGQSTVAAATALPFLLLLILPASTDAGAARPTISAALLAATGPAARRVGGAGRYENLARRALQDYSDYEPWVEPPEECHEEQGNLNCPSGGGCMHESQVCDGKPHCSDGSDESPDFCREFDCELVRKTLLPTPLLPHFPFPFPLFPFPPFHRFPFSPLPLFPHQGHQVSCPMLTGCMPTPKAPHSHFVLPPSPRSRGACPRAGSATAWRTARTAVALSPSSPLPLFLHWVRQVSCPSLTGCVPPGSECNGVADCADGHQVSCPTLTGCMPPGSECNGVADCADGSDEGRQCRQGYQDDSNYCADQGLEQCPSDRYACLRQEDYCDGYETCYGCPEGFKKCADGLQCVAEGLFCDGTVNCNDGSDEGAATCAVNPPAGDGTGTVTTTPPPPPPPPAETGSGSSGSGTTSPPAPPPPPTPTVPPGGGSGSGGSSGSSGGTVVLSAEEVARQRKEAAARRAAAVAAKKQAAAAKHAAVEARRAKQEAKAAAIAEKKKKQEEKAAAVAEKKRLQEAKAAAIAEKKRKQEEKAAAIAEKKRMQEAKAAAIAEKKRKQAEKAAAIEAKKKKQAEKAAAIEARKEREAARAAAATK
ncbi:unnamed protein product [Closterium sp. Naga37s-1]|nr:unnamed protein product [Closterium sp. Naga37s-1]